MHKLKLTLLMIILLVGSLLTSGCQSLETQSKPMPVKPRISNVYEIDNKVCFDKPDATKLGLYILELERGY
ncbi:o-spanin [Proteus phage Premi]|nr:o-spanin [Proteus phage Premi]